MQLHMQLYMYIQLIDRLNNVFEGNVFGCGVSVSMIVVCYIVCVLLDIRDKTNH